MGTKKTPDRIVLDAWFIHERLVLGLLGPARAEEVRRETARWLAAPPFPPQTIPAYVATQHLSRYLLDFGVSELVPTLLRGQLSEELVVGHTQAFYFRRSKDVSDRIEFHAKLSTDTTFTLSGHFSDEHCVGTSGRDNLSRRVRVHLIGHVTQLEGHELRLRPLFIGRRFFNPVDVGIGYIPDRRRIYPSEFDQFRRVADVEPATHSDLRLMKDLPEVQIKQWLAEIIGEPVVPKDHGGEKSDLYSSRLSISGEPVSAAFLLKGPSFFRPMTIAALGKQGDQIDRLYREPADVLILQHCHEVRAEVVNMMETYAWDSRRARRFSVLDGFDTLQVLRAYGKL